MWTKIYILVSVLHGAFGNMALHRFMSEGVKSTGYKILYGDEDITFINEVSDKEDNLKSHFDLNEALPPLAPEDVKCMISVDRYCSPEMAQTKAIIIQAIKDDCQLCTTEQKEKAGKVIASMMAHDRIPWKLFLTRCEFANPKNPPKEEIPVFKVIGIPEDVPSSKHKYVVPGIKTRIRRYVSRKI